MVKSSQDLVCEAYSVTGTLKDQNFPSKKTPNLPK